jgi:hypothetical protein
MSQKSRLMYKINKGMVQGPNEEEEEEYISPFLERRFTSSPEEDEWVK